LLAIGLPLTVAAGFVAARLLYSGVGTWACACMAASVAPTDAALGEPIMEDDRLPRGLRRALNVESGLNDGIATPLVNFSIAGAVAAAAGGTAAWEGHALRELGYGLLFGIALGLLGGWLLTWSHRHAWSTSMSRQVVPLAIALVAYAGAVELHGNGFVASFVAGLAFAIRTRSDGEEEQLELSRTGGELMSAVVWFLVGSTIIPVLDDVTWRAFVYAVIALTLVRMVPVAIALLGTGTDRATVALIGWFGPRGLASVVFAVLALDGLPKSEGNTVFTAVIITVLLSVLAHGLSAAPLATRYVRTRNPLTGEPPTGPSG
jgi:NhaP-type Na+/H+ or K+/H+ antiporter